MDDREKALIPILQDFESEAERYLTGGFTNDKGHYKLIADATRLLREVIEGQFHDFRNEKYSAPKMELVNILNDMATKAKDGEYDN